MKEARIRPVAKPLDFKAVKFTMADWEAATKRGILTVPYVTALENIRQSRGLYEFVPEAKAEMEVKVEGLSLDKMANDQLKLLVLQLGYRQIKKTMKREDLIKFAQAKLDSLTIADDEPEELAEEPADADLASAEAAE